MSVTDDTGKGSLDMGTGTAKSIVEVEMAEGGIHVIPPQQADDAAPEPNAFRVAGRSLDQSSGFGKLVGSSQNFFGGICNLRRGRLVDGF
jgi:hypothetical protein